MKKVLQEKLTPCPPKPFSDEQIEIIDMLKAYYLFEKESKAHVLARAILI